MLEVEIYEVGKGLARISEGKWRDMICTRRDQRVQMREKGVIYGLE